VYALFAIKNTNVCLHSTHLYSLVGFVTALKTTYHVFVKTGNKFAAGTDANVYIVLYGEIDDTGE